MTPDELQRPRWDIDEKLQSLIGANVRVAVESFSTTRWNGDLTDLISTGDFILQDNTSAAGLPFFAEGRLAEFVRYIAVIYVRLDPLSYSEQSGEGVLAFRGETAVILKGPATVRLAFPHFVERLPHDPDNYWRDLQMPNAQFQFSI
ncbi:MAG: hypothetical protein L0Z50_39930 [Verrucomicrobiales bacterium]|nr:hypothetical protein [Verrucomicrobiales bacterium]